MTTITALWFDRGQSSENWFRAFEAYGHAMASAASIELQLALYLVKKKAKDIGNNLVAPMQPDEYVNFANAMRNKTFSRLINLVKKEFSLSLEMIEALEIAKSARDYLAHNFWDINIGFVQSDAGIDLIVEQCANDAWHFKNVAVRLEQEIGFSVQDFAEMTAHNSVESAKELEEILAQYR